MPKWLKITGPPPQPQQTSNDSVCQGDFTVNRTTLTLELCDYRGNLQVTNHRPVFLLTLLVAGTERTQHRNDHTPEPNPHSRKLKVLVVLTYIV